MGGGGYSTRNRMTRSASLGYTTKSSQELFQSRSINNAMDPGGIKLRESRDSQEHPNSVPIILALDVTGSMGSIPHALVKQGLPDIMDSIIKSGIEDPQLLFLGIGDHECDQAPLQVGQFESSDELLDKWLTTIYLEGGGGGNDGESYMLAWYFAAKHTALDCFEKRQKKGFLFTIGDEHVLDNIPSRSIKTIMGLKQCESFTSLELLDEARKTYNVYHLHIKETTSGARQIVIDRWKQLMQDNLIIVENKDDVSSIISGIVSKGAVAEEVLSAPVAAPTAEPEIIL